MDEYEQLACGCIVTKYYWTAHTGCKENHNHTVIAMWKYHRREQGLSDEISIPMGVFGDDNG